MPLILTASVVIADQITKAVVVARLPLFHETGHTIEVLGTFFRLTHVRNLGIAFSIGHGLPPLARQILFIALPIAVIFVLYFWYYASDELTQRQRWFVAAVLGGGIGNLIDRIFRPLGVVDFLDVRFYGVFGMERWPTFNIADAAVVLGGLSLVVSVFLTPRGDSDEPKS